MVSHVLPQVFEERDKLYKIWSRSTSYEPKQSKETNESIDTYNYIPTYFSVTLSEVCLRDLVFSWVLENMTFVDGCQRLWIFESLLLGQSKSGYASFILIRKQHGPNDCLMKLIAGSLLGRFFKSQKRSHAS